MAGTRDGDRNAESRRILDRVAREAAFRPAVFLGRGAERARGHLAAGRCRPGRLDRGLGHAGSAARSGIIVIAAFLVWLVIYLASGA